MNFKPDRENSNKTTKSSFRRSEIKYDISDFSEEFFINKYNLKEIYPEREITSIYFDTKEFDYYHLSQEGILPRKKVRLRYYEVGKYNLEIKFQDYHSKIKKIIKLINIENINYHLFENGISEFLIPTIKVNFSRRYFSNFAGRFTIDKNLNYSYSDTSSLFNTKATIRSNQVILEIKNDDINDKVPYSFRDLELKEQRNSKYCNGVNLLYGLF